MIRWFRKRKLNREKEGSSLVSVIIGVMFLAAIGLTILTVASKYVVTVFVDRNSSDNFYQTEGILAEVRTGLLEYAGKSSEAAYQDILENYTAESKNMKDVFAKKYISGIAAALQGTAYNWDDADEKLGQLQSCELDNVKMLSKVPDAVTTKAGTNLAFVINYDTTKGYTLTLKNLVIDYTDEADYRSTIDADIVFRVPDYKFEGDSTFDELKDYIVISDDALKVNGANAGTAFTGKIYTGQMDSGIQIDSQNSVDFNSKSIVSRGSLDILTGAKVKVQGESGAGDLWLQNIRLKSFGEGGTDGSFTSLTMNENAYIANDLDIEDSHTKVSLSGKYYGYSYNKENDNSSEKAKAEYSSAILVNGLNTTLDASSLETLILAGRTFVSQGDGSKTDIMMGESMAAKSNQIAYLVPDTYIQGEHNPVATHEMNDAMETALKERLTAENSPLKKYLKASQPFTANYNSAGYAYLFLNFKDEKSANQYFYDYYTGSIQDVDEENQTIDNREQVAERAKTYLASTDMKNDRFSGNLYLIAGNIVYNYDATNAAEGVQSANYYDGSGKPKQDLLEDGKKMALNYLGRCKTLLSSGSTGRENDIRLHEDEEALVASKIIDFSKVTGTIDKTDSESGGRFTVVNGDYVIRNGTNQKGIVVAKGNVTVEADFTGLIIAGGKVTVVGNRTLKYDMILSGNLLEFAKTDEELAKIFWSLNGAVTQDPTALEQCISYQNWEKNAY